MTDPHPASAWRRAEARLRTGSFAHLLGGAIDLAEALAHYALARYGRRPPR